MYHLDEHTYISKERERVDVTPYKWENFDQKLNINITTNFMFI